MLEFFKKIFIVEFDGKGKERGSFFWYQFLLIISIFVFLGTLFLVKEIFNSIDLNFFPACGKYCNSEEIKLGYFIEIFNNIFFIFSLLFLLKFNNGLVERFSFFKFSGKLEFFFQIFLTFLKIFIIGFIIFFGLNFLFFLFGTSYLSIYNLIIFEEKIIIFLFEIILFSEIFLFLFGVIFGKK